MKADDSARAVAILEAGLRMLPGDLQLQRALAASLLTHGDAKPSSCSVQSGRTERRYFRRLSSRDRRVHSGAGVPSWRING
jgi:hypothetical protein